MKQSHVIRVALIMMAAVKEGSTSHTRRKTTKVFRQRAEIVSDSNKQCVVAMLTGIYK